MAIFDHLEKIREGVTQWNALRRANADLRPDLGGANLHAARLGGVNLTGANLVDTDLSNANLRRADLRGAGAVGANLSGAMLSEASLAGVVFRNANLRDTSLHNASLRAANLSKASLVGADLSNTDMSRANLSGADLSGADLRSVNMSGANLTDTILSNARMDGGDGAGPTDLSYANIKDTIFTERENPAEDERGHFFDLSTVLGLDTARFDPGFLANYINECFAYAHLPNLLIAKDIPGFIDAAASKMRFLQRLYAHEDFPPELVSIVNVVSFELLKHVQAHPEATLNPQPRQFEKLIGDVLASYGWNISLAAATRDGDCDIFAINHETGKAKQSWIIECKLYPQHRKVDVDIARVMYQTRNVMKAGDALFATTSNLAEGTNTYKSSCYDLDANDRKDFLKWIARHH